ncbi:hypothetical protein [Alloactinosynnema sp. L-07]|uniref:hypothetical protein n=1 Tax=Alloactinosynnema sp. L-07 TaxID=1653480 RepID=UPI00065EF452|nr:hypothetical protein [Alloactinosynnema sp. L-07]CRK60974.1 hypothetical protein [Alloactinosynnema sp. L-07]
MTDTTSENVNQTYLTLRLAMVLLVGLLFLSVIVQYFASAPDCLQHSISAYYFTPARAVFVGALCAIGACLIVYRGSTDTENVLLDYSGFMAFVVAFVPTTVDNTCAVSNVPTAEELTDAVSNNVLTLLVVGFGAALLAMVVRWLRKNPDRPLSKYARISVAVTLTALAAGTVFFLFWGDTFERIGHAVSAIALFAGIIGVVMVNAVGFAKKQGDTAAAKVATNRYSLVAFAMGLSLVGCLVSKWLGFGHWLFVLEALLIAEFAVFWMLQTTELRGKVSRAA